MVRRSSYARRLRPSLGCFPSLAAFPFPSPTLAWIEITLLRVSFFFQTVTMTILSCRHRVFQYCDVIQHYRNSSAAYGLEFFQYCIPVNARS
jgi:hypothetical protein